MLKFEYFSLLQHEVVSLASLALVWQDNRNGNYDIYMYNISTLKETEITAETCVLLDFRAFFVLLIFSYKFVKSIFFRNHFL